MRAMILVLGLLLVSCDSEEERQYGVASTQFAVCNSMLSACNQGSGAYCLFGYKWGENNQFTPAGFDVVGPREAAMRSVEM